MRHENPNIKHNTQSGIMTVTDIFDWVGLLKYNIYFSFSKHILMQTQIL